MGGVGSQPTERSHNFRTTLEALDEHDSDCDVYAEADDERVGVEFNPQMTSTDEIRAISEDSWYEVEETPPVNAD